MCVCVCVFTHVREFHSFIFSELRELVKMHGAKAHENEEPLNHDEVMMMSL